MKIVLCTAPEMIMSTFKVMKQLRPLLREETYVQTILNLKDTDNYQLVGSFDEENLCIAAAGYRIKHSLFLGGNKELYIDDLVTDAAQRSRGIGQILMDWLNDVAKNNHCVGIALDSGLDRRDAHRFYEAKMDMQKTAYHFRMFF